MKPIPHNSRAKAGTAARVRAPRAAARRILFKKAAQVGNRSGPNLARLLRGLGDGEAPHETLCHCSASCWISGSWCIPEAPSCYGSLTSRYSRPPWELIEAMGKHDAEKKPTCTQCTGRIGHEFQGLFTLLLSPTTRAQCRSNRFSALFFAETVGQDCQIQILVNLADVVFGGQHAVHVLVHRQPAIAFRISPCGIETA